MTLGDLKIICKDCGGTGLRAFPQEAGSPVETCQDCQGSGYRAWGLNNLDDLVETVDDIKVTVTPVANVFEAYQVLEATDTTEYNALTDAQKAGYALLLSCGKVDLGAGKVGRTRLVAWFGAGSQTVANLTALIG